MKMTERPILFSGPMVRAILAGVKSQTRRVWKLPRGCEWYAEMGGESAGWFVDVDPGAPWWLHVSECRCPYGAPGDRLRVKESAWMWCERRPNGTTKTGRQKWLYVPMRAAGLWYAADHRTKPNIGVVSPDTGNAWGWRLKIGRFLPSWASRITLEITGVRVERLQDISEADAKAEGIVQTHGGWGLPHGEHYHAQDPRDSYWSLWEAINGPGSVAANPWTWVLEFKRV